MYTCHKVLLLPVSWIPAHEEHAITMLYTTQLLQLLLYLIKKLWLPTVRSGLPKRCNKWKKILLLHEQSLCFLTNLDVYFFYFKSDAVGVESL